MKTKTTTIAAILIGTKSYAVGVILSGSGLNLPLSPNPTFASISPSIISTTAGFTGTWAAPADTPWVGSFDITGTLPTNGNIGTTTYTFNGLNAGALPAESFFYFGDLDGGSGSESFSLRAWDVSGNLLNLWLDCTFYQYGRSANGTNTPILSDMPGWAWNATTSTYSFNGFNVSGNPTLGVILQNNQSIFTLEVVKAAGANAFSISAPLVPEPSSALLSIPAFVMLLRRRRD